MSSPSSTAHAPQPARSRLAFLRRPWVSIPVALLIGFFVAGFVLEQFVTTTVIGGQTWTTMSLPYPNLVGVAIMLGVAIAIHIALWPHQFARRARFSMRTLLLLTAVAAAVTSFVLVPHLRTRAQRLAAERLEATAEFERGKVVELELRMPGQPGPGRLLDEELRELEAFPELRRLSLRYTHLTDAGLEHLKSTSQLEELELGHTFYFDPQTDMDPILSNVVSSMGVDLSTPAGVQRLKSMIWNHDVIVRNRRITDAGMREVAQVASLRTLSLENTAVGDEGLRALQALPNLEELDLRMTFVTDDGLKHLAGFPSLRRLNVGNMRYLTDASMPHLGRLTQLTKLTLPASITDAGLAHLAALKNLQTLDLRQCPVTDEGVRRLQEQLPGCQIRRQ